MKKRTLLLLILLVAVAVNVACNRAINKDDAMSRLAALPEYQTMFYAPMHIGRAVLTGENHKNPQDYIKTKFGTLIAEKLVNVQICEQNAWRTVIEISLTDQGKTFCDPRRTDNEHAFVAVCAVKPVAVDTLITITPDSTQCKYVIEQSNVTPFGQFLQFEDGKKYKVSTIFTR